MNGFSEPRPPEGVSEPISVSVSGGINEFKKSTQGHRLIAHPLACG